MTKIEEIEWKLDTLTKMHKNAKEDYEKISNDINECQKALAELKESKKEGKWKPDYGARYWFRCDNGDIDVDDWFDDAEDFWRYNNIPIFKTEEECERYWHFMDTVKEKSYEFSREDWNDTNTIQYTIAYNNELDELHIDSLINTKYLGEIYFRTREDAQYIIDNFKDELMEYFV